MSYSANREFDVAVVGLGYVGLPTALMLAASGLKVAGVDTDERKIAKLQSGACTVDETAVCELFYQDKVRHNFLPFTKSPKAAAYILAVPTPLDRRRRVADLDALKVATERLLPVLDKDALVVV